jgi:hypothetical protein
MRRNISKLSFGSGIFLIFFLFVSFSTGGDSVYTAQHDSIAWDIKPTPKRIIAVGDLHGDFNALLKILEEQQLVNRSGKWTGGGTHVVILGDYSDRGDDTRYIMEFLIDLEQKAYDKGGRVHVLLGNHELMVTKGDYLYVSQRAIESFNGFSGKGTSGPISEMKYAYSGNSKYAVWLRNQKTILKIGDSLFVHAGLDRWALEKDPGKINDIIRAWMAYYQGMGPKPKKKKKWAVDKNGPLWTRELAEGRIPGKTVEAILEKYKVKRIIIGHTRQRKISQLYGGKVFNIDTSMSYVFNDGILSCLEINDSKVFPHYYQRSQSEHPLKELIQKDWNNSSGSHSNHQQNTASEPGTQPLCGSSHDWNSGKYGPLL